MTVALSVGWPVLERIPLVGDLAISPHGLGIAGGFMVGAVLMVRRAQRRGLGHEHVADVRQAVQELLTWAAIGAIVGARLFYVIPRLGDYADDPLAILRVWEGGITFLGGLAGAVLFALPVMRRRGYRFIQVMDSAAPGIAMGLIFGRLGDLMIGDHIGNPAPNFPLAWRCTSNLYDAATNSFGRVPPLPYPAGIEPTAGCFDIPVHQTALYDLLIVLVLLVVMLRLERRPRWDGFFVVVYVYAYGLGRVVTDFLREDDRIIGLTGSQWSSILAMVAITGFLAAVKPWRRQPWAWSPPDFDTPWMVAPDAAHGTAVDAVGDDDPARASSP